jgi:Raf kinase inhibitor-like YbhB/YbcL family protein
MFVPDNLTFNSTVMLKYPEQKISSLHFLLLFAEFLFLASSCEKKNQESESNLFILTSPEISSDSLLPVLYTCDGESASLPLEWKGFPEGTKCFALIMHHVASPEDIHWYWVLYNIPLSVNALQKNANGIGTAGNNSVNGRTEYAPPCSQGPGSKSYILTIYALSEKVIPTIPSSEVTRQVLLDAIDDITLATATLTVKYSRNI